MKNSSTSASFGAIHINNTNLERATYFWTEIVGMKCRNSSASTAEFWTKKTTLVVVHKNATHAYQKGFSWLYHVAIHAPNPAAFAHMIHRLDCKNYTYSPTDHTASKSIYLDDPDGINIEFTLETPERLKRVLTKGGIKMEGTDGIVRSATAPLDVKKAMEALEDTDSTSPISEETYIGHIHFYAKNIDQSRTFYKKLWFLESNYFPEYMFADLGDGSAYTHRVAINTRHGKNKPLAPKEYAGLHHIQLIYKNKTTLDDVLTHIWAYEEKDDGYRFTDPTGNNIVAVVASRL